LIDIGGTGRVKCRRSLGMRSPVRAGSASSPDSEGRMGKGLAILAASVALLIGLTPAIALAAPATRAATTAPAAAKAGEVVEKYDDGAVRFRYVTDAKGVRTGAYEELFPSGRAKVRGTYAAGQRTGAWQTYDEGGKVVESATYRKDVLDGAYTWRAAGAADKREFRGTYREGYPWGLVDVLGEKGTLVRQVRYPRALAQVREMWTTHYPAEGSEPKFLAKPSEAPPYKAGRLAPETLEESLKLTKLYRYLSGVPWQHLRLDPRANELAQHAAVVLKKTGVLTHTPGKPDDMDEAFFKLGYAGCSQSNLSRGRTHVVWAIRSQMADSDPSNITEIGHRRWILRPGLKQVGFGYADGWAAVHILDNSRDVPNFDVVAFPGEGYFPKELLEKHYAWSVHFHKAKLLLPQQGAAQIKVIVTRLDEQFQAVGEPAAASVINVFAAEVQGWNTVVFLPEFKAVEVGRYWVEVQGLRTPKGVAPPFRYLVELVDMKRVVGDANK
jgi:hypothetical protein